MLHRSASSRRRKATRNHANDMKLTNIAPKGRRASLATEKLPSHNNFRPMERDRSPRGSIVPNIALDIDSDSAKEEDHPSICPDYYLSKRNLSAEGNNSFRKYLTSDEYNKISRNSLTPDVVPSSRNSLVPEMGRSPRNSLTLDSRYSLLADGTNSIPLAASRTSLAPDNGGIIQNRSPRHSLIPDCSRSPRGSIVDLGLTNQSPRGSICPEIQKSPIHVDRSPRGSIGSTYMNQRSHESLDRSPRGSICPENNRSPRGSVCPESNRSPRGSISPYDQGNRSTRNSIELSEMDRNRRRSIEGIDEDIMRGTVTDIINRSPRTSISGYDRRSTKASLSLPDPRRSSSDQGSRKLTYGSNADSRRASSSISQFSGSESRKLCTGAMTIPEKYPENVNTGTTTYGSVVFQLKGANIEANTICDFVFRALGVIYKTRIVTACLVILSTMSLLMLIFGLHFFKDCPAERRIPIYMVTWGLSGFILMGLMLYVQIQSRKSRLSNPRNDGFLTPMQSILIVLTIFLTVGFVLGNIWILRIKWPQYKIDLYEPNKWCDRNLYVFSIVHLHIMYAVLAMNFIVALGFAFYRIFACPFPGRYK